MGRGLNVAALPLLLAGACVLDRAPPPELVGGSEATSVGSGQSGSGHVIDGSASSIGGSSSGYDVDGATTGPGDSTGDLPVPPDNLGDCCVAGNGVGCVDPVVAACVCAIDEACCTEGWDQLCAKLVDQLGCAACVTGIDPTRVPSCCEPHGGASCLDVEVAQCVCASDPYCCDVVWDQSCADMVSIAACGVCPDPIPMPGSCCEIGLQPGCQDPVVAGCVCAQDSFCCDNAWDDICVGEVMGYGCGTCPEADGTGSGSGSTGEGSDTGATATTGMAPGSGSSSSG